MTRNALGETESKLLSESSRAILLAGDNRALSAWLVRLLRKDHSHDCRQELLINELD
jgi:hypothetical protein